MLCGRTWWATLAVVGLTGCAVGADGGVLDASIALPTHDATASKDGQTTQETSVPIDTGSPGMDAGDGAADGRVTDSAATDAGDAMVAVDAPAPTDTGVDAPVTQPDAAPCPTGTMGPGCTECTSTFHLCGGTCIVNGPNVPETGCALGCGTAACAANGGEVAACTPAGECTIACAAGTMMCGGAGPCVACCVNSDCASGTCSGGTCGCPPDFGTCNAPCDTNLTTNSNCGFCGDQCDTGFAGGCGFLGLGGCSCKGSGDPSNYSCQ